MSSFPTPGTENHGSVVAFEGHPEIISTQLRLLPNSPQLLILPSVETYIPKDQASVDEPASIVKSVHVATLARHDAAQNFIKGSTPSNKRIAFLNGGSPSAQALCIQMIMKHHTNGDCKQAETLFRQTIQRGVAGLDDPQPVHLEQQPSATEPTSDLAQTAKEQIATGPAQSSSAVSVTASSSDTTSTPRPAHSETDSAVEVNRSGEKGQHGIDRSCDEEDEFQDPITRAMRAADALDRETENLQPSNELDLTITCGAAPRQRSNSLPLYGYTDNLTEAAPFLVFGAQQREEIETVFGSDDVIPEEDEPEELEEQKITVKEEPVDDDASFVSPHPTFSVHHYEDTSEDLVFPDMEDIFPTQKSPTCVGETYGLSAQPTPFSDVFGLRSPGDVVFGEASLLDMRTTSLRPSLARVRSLDRIYPSSPRMRDLCIPEEGSGSDTELESPPRRPRSVMVITDEKNPSSSRLDYIAGPRTIIVKPKRDVAVTVMPVPHGRKRKRASYVDRGTDAEVIIPAVRHPYQALFPLIEDLIIYFKDESPNALLERQIDAFKEGKCPLPESTNKSEAVKDAPPRPDPIPEEKENRVSEEQTTHGDDVEPAPQTTPAMSVDEYDPFAYVQQVKAPVTAGKPARTIPVVKISRPPTPDQTPAPSEAGKEDKFHEFKITSTQAAVTVQTSLRSILNTYFPSDSQGYCQFQSCLLPELDDMWQPVFREVEPTTSRKSHRMMDQILAIGSQKGVDAEYSTAIISQLEKLGRKESGLSRSGKLDFRYLLANAMQAFTAQPLSAQSSDNPFNNNYLLATLIVPHLERYLALHSEVRYLLLEYPPEHLGTILALQRLIGVDLFKVAQIIDAKSKTSPFTNLGGTPVSKVKRESMKQGATPSCTNVNFSMANFLLTSAATDSEIAEFISTVWKILNTVCDFYRPETVTVTPPKKVAADKNLEKPTEKSSEKAERKKPPPLTSSFSPFPKITEGPKSPLSPAPSAQVLPPPTPTVMPSIPSRPPSIAETTRTFKSFKSKHSRNMSRRKPATAGPPDGMSVYTFNPEEDSDYDAEERRLMPIFLQKRQVRKGNSRKALKFLGLA